ncbi:hypothetical protein TYRP_003424 [Tyrophagus putrescentiae]|nr:hypothetical protein TYRP_003424 [Tyrophagus putrescentiae]
MANITSGRLFFFLPASTDSGVTRSRVRKTMPTRKRAISGGGGGGGSGGKAETLIPFTDHRQQTLGDGGGETAP